MAEQRYQTVLAVIADGLSVRQAAEKAGVSRQSVHAWLARYEAEGLEGLVDRSHRPASCPHQMPAEVEAALLELRRSLWPLREATGALLRNECPRFSAAVQPYLRDVHDHVVQLLDLLENYRELGTSLMELHLATTSHRLNEVMKVLTMIATIFIPLTFVTGIYGMNFEHLPGKDWAHGFDLLMGLMAAIAVSMLVWFRRRRWI